MRREGLLDHAAHHRFGAAVGLGDRIERTAARFVACPQGGAEKWENDVAGGLGEMVYKAGEIDDAHGKPALWGRDLRQKRMDGIPRTVSRKARNSARNQV